MTIASSVTALRPSSPAAARLLADPRHFQIAVLGGLFALQLGRGDLGASALQGAVTTAAALAAQAVFARLLGENRANWRSPLITGLSLTLLLRADLPLLWVAAAVIAIGSKFLLRARNKHFFNPATAAIVVLLLASSDIWVSPGQWGSSVWLGLLLVCCGGLVLERAARADIALAFLGSYAALLAGRAWWLGDPAAIPLHQLQSGALLLFAFFMITDPRSTPDSRLGRILFAIAVAGLAYWLQFGWQLRPALFYALAAVSPLTPLVDRLIPAGRFRWPAGPAGHRHPMEA